ncbi:hypothetical protein K1719_008136 [Acacia pycnantha]|nr:hypothetical protein K1719_008136 [Acacia pycnantha]
MVRGSSRPQSPIPAPHDPNYGTTWLAAATAGMRRRRLGSGAAKQLRFVGGGSGPTNMPRFYTDDARLEDFATVVLVVSLALSVCHRSPRLGKLYRRSARPGLIESPTTWCLILRVWGSDPCPKFNFQFLTSGHRNLRLLRFFVNFPAI